MYISIIIILKYILDVSVTINRNVWCIIKNDIYFFHSYFEFLSQIQMFCSDYTLTLHISM